MSRIVQAANFVTPRSGGLRTTLRQLATGYHAAGHEVVQIVAGERDGRVDTAWGTLVTVRAPRVPGTGYRVLTRWPAVLRAVEAAQPDRLEVHDRTTLRRLGHWAGQRGVPSMVISHERLDRLLAQWLPPGAPVGRLADRSNAALTSTFDRIVCTTAWAGEEFERLGVTNLERIPLGVDLVRFHPSFASTQLRQELAGAADVLLLMASRLSREKRPELAVDTVAELVRRGHRVRLVVAGDGPLRRSLERRAAGLPVRFTGFVGDRERLASLLATADVVLAPGPVETFGLAALEALASGTPAVVNAASALPEVLGRLAGRCAPGSPGAFADSVQSLLAQPGDQCSAAARARAECFPWTATVQGFLRAHRLQLTQPQSRVPNR